MHMAENEINGNELSGNDTAPVKSAKSPEKRSAIAEIYDWVETFCIALCAVVLIFTFLCRFVTVDGHSMDYTLADKDRLIISDINYTPKTGDIVVVQDVNEPRFSGPIIKRVIATEGEIVDIDFDTWKVTVTDKDGNVTELDETYVNFEEGRRMNQPNPLSYPHAVSYPHEVTKGCVFVMGDNRNNSLDSRYVGDIDSRMVLGKAYVRIFPFTTFGLLH